MAFGGARQSQKDCRSLALAKSGTRPPEVGRPLLDIQVRRPPNQVCPGDWVLSLWAPFSSEGLTKVTNISHIHGPGSPAKVAKIPHTCTSAGLRDGSISAGRFEMEVFRQT